MEAKQLEEEHRRNAVGHLVPISMIDEIDLARDELVLEIVKKARELQDAMTGFKSATMGDIAAFIQLSAEQYGAQLGGKKGNVALTSFDGKYKVERSMAEYMRCDERIHVAKKLVDQCVHRWLADGSRPEIRAIIEHSFQTDTVGRFNIGRLLDLMRLNIDDEEWQRGMAAIRDSLQVASSKAYIRIYERIGDSDKWQAIALDMAAL